jgi:hypothetical protein
MPALEYYLPRPPFDLTPEKQAAFEDLFQSTPPGNTTAYHLPYPKWEYLSYLCDTRAVVLHGSQVTGIDRARRMIPARIVTSAPSMPPRMGFG